MLFDQLSSILFVGYFVTAPFILSNCHGFTHHFSSHTYCMLYHLMHIVSDR